jgi:hypothetical protein
MRVKRDIDGAAFIAAGLQFQTNETGQGVITFPGEEISPGVPFTVTVSIEGGKLAFFPDRSGSHRKVLAVIGYPPVA